MAWPCPHWPQTVFFGGDAGEEQCSWGPPDSRARSPTGRSQGSGKRHGDVEEYPSADRDRFFIGKKAPFLHYFLGPSDVRWQTLPTLKREDPKKSIPRSNRAFRKKTRVHKVEPMRFVITLVAFSLWCISGRADDTPRGIYRAH